MFVFSLVDDRVGIKSGPAGAIAGYQKTDVTCRCKGNDVAAAIGGYRRPAEQVGGRGGGKNRRPDSKAFPFTIESKAVFDGNGPFRKAGLMRLSGHQQVS